MTLWLRSWPGERPPAGRPHVVDDLVKLRIRGHDLATGRRQLSQLRLRSPHAGFVLVEWDIAYTPDDRDVMEAWATQEPQSVATAPYVLYPRSTGLRNPVWAHSDGDLPGERWGSVINFPTADHFGLGMTYLPWRLVDDFLNALPTLTDKRMTDTNLSIFHKRTRGVRVPVLWRARPVHLHW